MQKNFTVSKEEAKNLLIPFAQEFYDAIVLGFDDYKKYDSERAHIHDNTVKSNLVRSYVMNRVRKIVIANPELKLIEKKRMSVVALGSYVRIRFKKLNKKYKSQNIRTKQVEEFRSRVIKFDGIQALPIDAGWRVDEFYNEIKDVHFVCPDGDGNLWRIPIEDLAVKKNQAVFFQVPEEEIIQIVTPKRAIDNDNSKAAG